jgi:hypothetical protein
MRRDVSSEMMPDCTNCVTRRHTSVDRGKVDQKAAQIQTGMSRGFRQRRLSQTLMGVLKIGRTLGIGTSLAGALMELRREVALLAGPKE